MEEQDPLLKDVALLFIKEKMVSTSLIQRRMKLGYFRACRIMAQLEELNIVKPTDRIKPGILLVTTAEELEKFNL